MKFSQRRRAKEATLALLRLNDDDEIDVRVFVLDDSTVLDITYPEAVGERVKGVMSLGVDMTGNPSMNDLDANNCQEFYSGAGITRFRGV